MRLIFDPYPELERPGLLTLSWDNQFSEVRSHLRYYLNYTDPQPPGYRYRLPRLEEIKQAAEDRRAVVDGVYSSVWPCKVRPLAVDERIQRASFYRGGVWLHLTGVVRVWCLGEPPQLRLCVLGDWRASPPIVKGAIVGLSQDPQGYRLVRGGG